MISIWTIYDHPTDYPEHYVARLFHGETPTDSVIQSKDLDTIRGIMIADFGLTCLTRSPDDDPKIIETWL
jgi:hypothetical protein